MLPSRTGLLRTHTDIKAAIQNLSAPISLVAPISILYLLNSKTFQEAWKGRAPYILFLWLFFLEFVLAWKKLSQKESGTTGWFRIITIATATAIPTIYVTAKSFLGLDRRIVELGKLVNVPSGGGYGDCFLQYSWPLSIECLLFTVCFTASILLIYRIYG